MPPRAGESGGHRRERGWLHNLRGLTCFALGEPREALEHEKRALACIEGLSDASSVHLRINLLSNVSVLQEKTGRHRQALATWARFERAAGASNTPFAKHHAYRAAGLALLAADRDAATAGLERSLACAEESRDDFHACEIRLETGGLLVRAGDAAGAYACFAAGEEAARRLGDPYRIALALAGQAVCGGRAPGAEVAAVAARSLANAGRARALCERADSAVGAAELLPGPRTKLNRPFDLVNFQG
ncbi:hypothetical protein [Thermocatellispora tengchongensis]|uniref:hypothetical protein n=1 Tax=Thermocatellispora tengchongensis TaxID=1073253 RepID=UPI003632F872